ncbi:hypothetical protein COF68_05615 [Bacillus toyonensis]|uniref:PH domain-containing protein n=1 Tax=Bacillus toyonensis TaxID=155322 RepID=UPI000BFE7559|nr:PH domain-containing protein [Bacillus toyonensis]PHE64320.1 hypothetical protein COF68_05615 [Bacillus toyonensis]
MLTNKFLNNFFTDMKREDETYMYYLYVRRMSSSLEDFKLGKGLLLADVSKVICFTNKRLILVHVRPFGGLDSYSMKTISMEDIKLIHVKDGFSGVSIKVDLKENKGSMRLNPNSFVLGLSNHKKNLKELIKLYKQ